MAEHWNADISPAGPGQDGDGVGASRLLHLCPNRFALPILQEFIRRNDLDDARLLALNQLIREARENKKSLRDSRIAWEGLAVFALYVYFGITSVAEIASLVGLGNDAIKKWINAFYSAFDIPPVTFPDRASRRMQLRVKAAEADFIRYPIWLPRPPLEE